MKPSEIAKALRKLSGRHGVYDIFRDWVSSMALALANGVDRRPEVHAAREAEYMAIVARHAEEPSVMPAFKALLHDGLVPALEGEPSDVLGEVFHLLELHNKDAGQFLTPWPLALLCAEMTPVHVLDGWGPRLAIHRAIDRARALVEAVAAEPDVPPSPEPIEQLPLFGGP